MLVAHDTGHLSIHRLVRSSFKDTPGLSFCYIFPFSAPGECESGMWLDSIASDHRSAETAEGLTKLEFSTLSW